MGHFTGPKQCRDDLLNDREAEIVGQSMRNLTKAAASSQPHDIPSYLTRDATISPYPAKDVNAGSRTSHERLSQCCGEPPVNA